MPMQQASLTYRRAFIVLEIRYVRLALACTFTVRALALGPFYEAIQAHHVSSCFVPVTDYAAALDLARTRSLLSQSARST